MEMPDSFDTECGKTVITLKELKLNGPEHIDWIHDIMSIARIFCDAMLFHLAGPADYVLEFSDFRKSWEFHRMQSASSDTIEINPEDEDIAWCFYKDKTKQGIHDMMTMLQVTNQYSADDLLIAYTLPPARLAGKLFEEFTSGEPREECLKLRRQVWRKDNKNCEDTQSEEEADEPDAKRFEIAEPTSKSKASPMKKRTLIKEEIDSGEDVVGKRAKTGTTHVNMDGGLWRKKANRGYKDFMDMPTKHQAPVEDSLARCEQIGKCYIWYYSGLRLEFLSAAGYRRLWEDLNLSLTSKDEAEFYEFLRKDETEKLACAIRTVKRSRVLASSDLKFKHRKKVMQRRIQRTFFDEPPADVQTPSQSPERYDEEVQTPPESPEHLNYPLASSSSNYEGDASTDLDKFRLSTMYQVLNDKLEIIKDDRTTQYCLSEASAAAAKHGFVRFYERYPPMDFLSNSWICMQKLLLIALKDDAPRIDHLKLLQSVRARPKGKHGHTKRGEKKVYPKGTRESMVDDIKGLLTLYKFEYRAVGAACRGLALRDLHTSTTGVSWRTLTSKEWKKSTCRPLA